MDSHVHARSADLARYVDEGITTVRNLWGFAGLLEGAAALVRDGAVAPTIESASPGVDGPGSPWPQTQLITDPGAADALVTRLSGEGWRWLKVYSHLDARVFDAVVDAADAHGIRFLGHVPFTVPLQHALDRRMLSIEHLTGYELALGGSGTTPTERWASMSVEEMPSVAAATAAAGTWNCPTMTVVKALLQGPETMEGSRRRRELVGRPARGRRAPPRGDGLGHRRDRARNLAPRRAAGAGGVRSRPARGPARRHHRAGRVPGGGGGDSGPSHRVPARILDQWWTETRGTTLRCSVTRGR